MLKWMTYSTLSSSEHLGTFWSLAAIMYHFRPLSLIKFILRLINSSSLEEGRAVEVDILKSLISANNVQG